MLCLSGYDNRSTVYDAGEYVLRRITAEYFEEMTAIYDIYKERQLEHHGIVATEIDKSSTSLLHKKFTISYPYEWTPNMFKDAVLFHLGLFTELDRHGLTLKDALPNNIVFNHCEPVFVDFSSLVRTKKLVEEAWLVEGTRHLDARFTVVDRMLTPYLLIPFAAMMKKDYQRARRMLSERACNCGSPAPAWKDLSLGALSELVGGGPSTNLVSLVGPFMPETVKKITEIRFLVEKKRRPFIDFVGDLSKLVADADVTPRGSAYLSYYKNKKENFDYSADSLWSNKQKSVSTIVNSWRPATVLDIGSNTGWFSILAARLGAEVIATDIDESSIDSLYLHAKSHDLSILPLTMSFDNLTREIYGVEDRSQAYAGRNFKENPLYLPATRRLQADMVLCLGLVHHLFLGMGKTFDEVMKVLALLAKKHLVLEFVAIDDKLIQDEPSFFRNLNKYSAASYTMDLVIGAAAKYFKLTGVFDSDSPTRKILAFEHQGRDTDE